MHNPPSGTSACRKDILIIEYDFGHSRFDLDQVPVLMLVRLEASCECSVNCPLTAQADICLALSNVRFSNRPFWVKRFQTFHRWGVDVAHGLVLLFGIGTRPFHHGIRGRGGTIF
jgi:hypothetical protein